MLEFHQTYGTCLSSIFIICLSLTGCGAFEEGDKTDDYKVSDTLDERIKSESESDGKAKKQELNRVLSNHSSGVSFDQIARIEPPTVSGEIARPTALNFDGANFLYIGYLLVGDEYGGGIDILDAQNPTNIQSATSLETTTLDVQDVAVGDNESIYVAEAKPPIYEDVSPSRVSVLDYNGGNILSSSRRLSGNVAKGVVGELNQTNHDFHVIDDNNAAYRFRDSLSDDSMEKLTAGSDLDFSGIAAHSGGLFILGTDGQIYTSDFGSGEQIESDGVDLDSGIDELGIGRLHAYEGWQGRDIKGKRVFAALGTEGFAVLDEDVDELLHRHNPTEDVYYTSVTLHGSAALQGGQTDLVYAATRGGIVEVYQVPNGGIKSHGLDLVSRIYVHRTFSETQANFVLGVRSDTKVYVVGGKEGTMVLDVANTTNQKPIEAAAFCTTESSYDSSDVTAVASEQNGSDEALEISWDSDTPVSTVVVQAGVELYNYSGGSSGTVLTEDGDIANLKQTPLDMCPENEELIVKKETFPEEDEDDEEDGNGNGNGNGN